MKAYSFQHAACGAPLESPPMKAAGFHSELRPIVEHPLPLTPRPQPYTD